MFLGILVAGCEGPEGTQIDVRYMRQTLIGELFSNLRPSFRSFFIRHSQLQRLGGNYNRAAYMTSFLTKYSPTKSLKEMEKLDDS